MRTRVRTFLLFLVRTKCQIARHGTGLRQYPADQLSLNSSALVLALLGKGELAAERARLAIRLSPFDSMNYLAFNALAVAGFCAGQFEEAHEAARRSVQLNPRFYVCHLFLVAALVGLGRSEDATRAARQVLALEPTFATGRFAVTVDFEPSVFKPLADAWNAAGLPK